MTTVFEGSPKFGGIRGDYARVTAIESLVLIRNVNALAREVATLVFSPDQARALAQAIMEAADKAEGGGDE